MGLLWIMSARQKRNKGRNYEDMMTIKTTSISLAIRDGSSMNTYVSQPDGTPAKQAIIVFQEAFGINDYIRSICDRFANQGYLAIAPELFHRTAPGFDAPYTDFPKAKEEMNKLTDEGMLADTEACHTWLQEQGIPSSQLHAVGFCMGGRAAFLANTALPFASAVSFYGSRTALLLDRASLLSGKMLFLYGGQDTGIDLGQRQAIEEALSAAGKPYTQLVFSEAGHGFFCDARAAYHEPSARLAWPFVLEFLTQASS